MQTFRKRSFPVAAIRFDPLGVWPECVRRWPDEFGYQPRDMSWGYVIDRANRRHHIKNGDWIVREIDGHFVVYPPDVFEALYEPA